MNAMIKPTNQQIRLSRVSPAYWRVTFDRPPLNLMGPEFVVEFSQIMTAIEQDEQVRVVVFDSAVEGFFLNHSDFDVELESLTSLPRGPTGLEAWPDVLVRIRMPRSCRSQKSVAARRAMGVSCLLPAI